MTSICPDDSFEMDGDDDDFDDDIEESEMLDVSDEQEDTAYSQRQYKNCR